MDNDLFSTLNGSVLHDDMPINEKLQYNAYYSTTCFSIRLSYSLHSEDINIRPAAAVLLQFQEP